MSSLANKCAGVGFLMLGLCFVACEPTMLELYGTNDTHDDSPETWSVELHLYDYGLHEPIRWAQACLQGMPEWGCATSDEFGVVVLQAPSGEVVSVVVEPQEAGYLSSRIMVKESDIFGFLNVPMLDSTLLSALADAWGYPLIADRSHILIRAEANTPDGGLEGVEFWRTPARGQGPYYFDTMAQPNPSTTHTNENGYGFLLNGSEGEMQIGATHDGVPCEANLPQDILGDAVFTGFAPATEPSPLTVVTFDCDNIQ